MRKIGITETILRDAHQSLIATRMRLDDMMPALEVLDKVGYHSLEVWGGATFDVCMRYLNEDPWARLDQIRSVVRKTPLQMLIRGQNLVGYRHYADDVVDAFVELAREHGISIFRVFDALNDIRNVKRAMNRAKEVGAHVQGTISYTVSPVHTIDGFVAFGQQLKNEGADSICIKDMAGIVSPQAAYDLVYALKTQVGLPVQLHTHSASGMSPAALLRAAQAGVDVVDCALSPFSWGSSQAPTETIWYMFNEGEWECPLDKEALFEGACHFEKVRERYSHLLLAQAERVDNRVLKHQIPGGMISNLLMQLKQQKALDKLDKVLEEIVHVRKDLGYPPLVTPTSQIVGSQAAMNVIFGGRYKMISKEVREYVRGMYGATPAPIDEALSEMVLKGQPRIEGRPADTLKPELEAARQGVAPYSERLEDALLYALFPPVATAFLKAKAEGTLPPETETLP